MTPKHLHTQQTVHAPLDRVFSFFADASNLEAITPPFLRFRILSPLPIEMKPGALIDYALSLHGVRFRWRTRISVWEPGVRFVDEQVRGPYALWVHEHTFKPLPDGRGTLVTDHVQYAMLGGSLADRLFVRPRLERIFAYRAEATRRLIEGQHASPDDRAGSPLDHPRNRVPSTSA